MLIKFPQHSVKVIRSMCIVIKCKRPINIFCLIVHSILWRAGREGLVPILRVQCSQLAGYLCVVENLSGMRLFRLLLVFWMYACVMCVQVWVWTLLITGPRSVSCGSKEVVLPQYIRLLTWTVPSFLSSLVAILHLTFLCHSIYPHDLCDDLTDHIRRIGHPWTNHFSTVSSTTHWTTF